jgi:hypothetical protein
LKISTIGRPWIQNKVNPASHCCWSLIASISWGPASDQIVSAVQGPVPVSKI